MEKNREKNKKITNAWVNRTLPDIFYETPKEAAERADTERKARLAAEARERALLEEVERLRQQQAGR